MEFTFDQSQLPIIGGDLLELSPPETGVVEAEYISESERQLEAPSSGSLVIESSSGFGWKRPLPSQVCLSLHDYWSESILMVF